MSVPTSPAKGQDLSRSLSKMSFSRCPSSRRDFLSSSPSFRKDASRSPSWPSFSRRFLFRQQASTNLSELSLTRTPLPGSLLRKNPSPRPYPKVSSKIALRRSSFRRPRLSSVRTTSRKQTFGKISFPSSSFSSSPYFDRIYFAASRNHSFRLYLTQGSYLKPAFSMSPSHRKSLDSSPSATRRPSRKPKFKRSVLAGLAPGTVNMDPCHSNTFCRVSLSYLAGKLPIERAHSVIVKVSRKPVPQQALARITVPRSLPSRLTFIQSPSHPLSPSMSFLSECSKKTVNSKSPDKSVAYSSSPCVTQKSSPSPAVVPSRSPRRPVISRRFPVRLSRWRRLLSPRARNRRPRLQLARSCTRGLSGLDLKKRNPAHMFNASSATPSTVVPDHVAYVSAGPVGQNCDGARRKAWHSCFLYYLLVLALTRAAAATGKAITLN
jgi:hypothetical protein